MKFLHFFFFFIVFTSFGQNQTQSVGFIENKGQIIDQKGRKNSLVKYLLNTNGLNVQLRENGFSYDVYEIKKHPLTATEKKKLYTPNLSNIDILKYPDFSVEYIYHRIDIDFENSNKSVKLIAENKSIDYDNYYNIPSEPNGIINVHKYQKIIYKNIYNNIDVAFFIPEDKTKPVEYNFIINEGGKISDIELKFNGVKTELVDNKIKMDVRFGQMAETLPMSWTENDYMKNEIAVSYRKIKKNLYGFESSENLENKKIIIDPVPIRLWGSYYGGDQTDYVSKSTTDSLGNSILTGNTYSRNNFTTSGAFIINHYSTTPNSFEPDGYVLKLDSNGIKIWATYLKATARDVDVDSNNSIITTGYSYQFDSIGTAGTHQPTKLVNDFDGFILKLNSNGVRIWGTYFGVAIEQDIISSACIDNDDNIFITGSSYSDTGIATSGTHKTTNNSAYKDVFVAKFTPNGLRIWGTYYGGNYDEDSYGIAVDDYSNVYIVGNTISSDGISYANFYQNILTNTTRTGFIAGFNQSGNLNFGTYLGGSSNDDFNRIDYHNNKILVSGKTISTNMSTSLNAPYPTPTSSIGSIYNGFFAVFSISGEVLVTSYFQDIITDSSFDSIGNIYIVGESSSIGIGTSNSYQPLLYNNFSMDSFLVKFSSNYIKEWGTYYGGESFETETILHIDKITNNIYIGGRTSSSLNISSPNGYQNVKDPNWEDIFYVKFYDCQSTSNIVVNSNSPTCIGNSLNLTASGGTNYQWSGPNGFTSTLQNPTITNVNTSHSGQYSCLITGTGGCDGTNSINVVVGDNIKPVPNVTSLPTINGDCNTIISTIPTATDNCAGTINGTTIDPLTYSLPGTYTINWNYNDGNGNSETQTQNIIISSVSLPIVTSPQTFCIQQNATVNDILISGTNINWYDSLTAGNSLPNSTILINGTTYYASQTINGCESLRVPITVSIQNTVAPNGNTNQIFCSTSNPTLNNIILSGTTLNWYANSSSTTILPNSTSLTDGVTYFATQTINGCESVIRFPVTVSIINSLNANNYSQSFCDDLNDGSENVLLSDYNSNLISSTVNTTFTYYTSLNGAENQVSNNQLNTNYTLNLGLNTIYVRLASTNGCHQVVKLELSLFQKPIISIDDIIPICKSTNIIVNAGSGFNSYLWSNGATTQSISISTSGTYSVTVTKNYGTITCSSTKSFDVIESDVATITSIETEDWTDVENVIIISTAINDNYQYSLDGINYQESNTFSGLISGFYTVFVKDECGIVNKDVVLLNYPKYFTPNNDGINDYWRIKFSQYEPNLTITIFDRYGKEIKSLSSNSPGWDGTYNGSMLISDDYWFLVKRADGREHRGHFTLKR